MVSQPHGNSKPVEIMATAGRFRILEQADIIDGKECSPGVWFLDRKGPIWVSGPVYVAAHTRDAGDTFGETYGKLLRFLDFDGNWREWVMPSDALSGGGAKVRGELLKRGLGISTMQRARSLLNLYINEAMPSRVLQCFRRPGWNGRIFVIPDHAFGEGASDVIPRIENVQPGIFTAAGTLEGWRDEIAARAIGNPILTLAISAAFAGPLLIPCDVESGGVHLTSESSTGKTVTLQAACSVWGGDAYCRSWYATKNGLWQTAVAHNNCLLALDEIAMNSPRELSNAVYMLQCDNKYRYLILSTGEDTIEAAMTENGMRVMAFNPVRILDIPATRKYGVWDNLHGMANGAEFSNTIKRAASNHYGHASRAFLDRLTRDTRDFRCMLKEYESSTRLSPAFRTVHELIASSLFSLIALAGELATEYGITGWTKGDATNAAIDAFNIWRPS